MDFTLDKKHEMARQLFRDFAVNEVKPLAQEVDETEHFPEVNVAKMQKLGFMGIPVPKELGGQGCDVLTYIMLVEELAKVCATTSVVVSGHTSLCIDPIMTYGTPEQKEKYVVPLAKGELLGAFALTAGVEGMYMVNDKFGAALGLNYTGYNTSVEVKKEDLVYSNYYFNIPVMANYYVAPGFALKAGVALNILSTAKIDGKDNLYNTKVKDGIFVRSCPCNISILS